MTVQRKSKSRIQLADRMSRLGTETAFAVSAEASALAAAGRKIYPFHVGDINLRTPRNIIEAAHKAALDGKTGYCPNEGIAPLREALAEDVNRSRGTSYGAQNVAIQPGGKPTIGKLLQILINPGDEVLYPSPGYPIYESQIEFLGGKPVPYTFREGESNFELQLAALEDSLNDKTKVLIYNDLQNPTAAESSPREMQRIAELALRNDLFVLSDEAYFDIRFAGLSQSIAGLEGMQERTVILYTFSKKYAMTGWRLGASIGPEWIIKAISQLNVNQESCTTHFVQWAGIEALTGDQSGAARILETLHQRRDRAAQLLNSIEGVRTYTPNATFYLFPNCTDAMRRKGMDYEQFRKAALEATGVSFCTRRHFGRSLPGETRHYMRFAYSGIDVPEIEEGLEKFKAFVEG